MILVRSDLDFSLKSINLDSKGRSIIMEAEVQGSLFLFVNIYAHNKVQDQCHFFENLNKNISLINVDVRIGSKAIAKRLENVLPNIIHYNQCAYAKGRNIFDAVRTIEDVMEFSERYNLDGRMICIDFKKAFDTVNRDFLFRTLTSFGFGPSFLQWIYTFYNNISSCVINNGFSTQPFPVERGVRQGDLSSAYLFIIVLEILCISIRNSKDICGFRVDNEDIRLSLFADDLTGFLKDNLSLLNFLKLIQDYGSCSGLKINHDKSEIMLLGNCAYTLQQVSAVSSN